jgi:addiction module HigA family antidote
MLPTHRAPTHPGEMLLKEFLEPLGVSQVDAATRMSIPFQRLNAIVKGRRAVSADTALLLEALTGWDAQIWLTLQAKWDLWHAMKARGNRPKVRPLRKIAKSIDQAARMSQGRKSLKPSQRVPREVRRGSRDFAARGSSCARGPSWPPR